MTDDIKKCPFCGEDVVLETRRSSMFPGKKSSHIYCKNFKSCGADFWFYGKEQDADEILKRFNRRINNDES